MVPFLKVSISTSIFLSIVSAVWSTIPPPGPTCRPDFQSSHGEQGSSGLVRGGRRWDARGRASCRRDGCRWNVRRRDGHRRDVCEGRGECRRCGCGWDDYGDDDRRGGQHTLHLDRKKGGQEGGAREVEEGKGGRRRRLVRIIESRNVVL